jgi:hypothetical protein
VSATETLEPRFVHEVPEGLEEGKLYISVEVGSVNHLCACGCGNEVVTPLHPARWVIVYDGETITLWQSVGSFGLPCRSHYVIDRNRVIWQPAWSLSDARAGSVHDRRAVERFYAAKADAGRRHPRRWWRRWSRQ